MAQNNQQQNTGVPTLPVNQVGGISNPAPAISTQTNPLVVTSKPARREFNNYSMNLTKMLSSLQNPVGQQGAEPTLENSENDPYIKALTQKSLLDDEASQALIATINANRYSQTRDATQMYDSYKRGLQLLGVQNNEAEFTPDLLMGKVQQVEMQKLAKLREYDTEATKALIEAKRAQADGDLSILREKMDRIKELKNEREDYLTGLATTLEAETSIADNRAEAIYESLQTLNAEEKEIFLNEVADTYGIPVTSLVSAVSRYANDSKSGGSTSSGGGSGTLIKPTPTNLKNLSGAGFSTEEINDLYKLVNDNDAESVYQALLSDSEITQAQKDAFAKAFGITGDDSGTEDDYSKYTPQYKGQQFKRRKLRKEKGVTRKLEKAGVTLQMVQEINDRLEQGYSIDQIAKVMGLNNTQFVAINNSLSSDS